MLKIEDFLFQLLRLLQEVHTGIGAFQALIVYVGGLHDVAGEFAHVKNISPAHGAVGEAIGWRLCMSEQFARIRVVNPEQGALVPEVAVVIVLLDEGGQYRGCAPEG